MQYNYTPLQGSRDPRASVYPLIPVLLMYNHQLIKTPIPGLIDSGAEHSYCLKVIGEYLRINFKRKKPIISRAVNGTEFKGYKENIKIIVNGKRIECPMIFSDELNPAFPLVMGQLGFFSNFVVSFDKARGVFSVD